MQQYGPTLIDTHSSVHLLNTTLADVVVKGTHFEGSHVGLGNYDIVKCHVIFTTIILEHESQQRTLVAENFC